MQALITYLRVLGHGAVTGTTVFLQVGITLGSPPSEAGAPPIKGVLGENSGSRNHSSAALPEDDFSLTQRRSTERGALW